MLGLQEILFQSIADKWIPLAISLLSDPRLANLPPSELLDKQFLKPGNEKSLCDYVHLHTPTNNQLEEIQLNLAVSTITVMNKASKSVFSKKVMTTMAAPCVLVKEFVESRDHQKRNNIVPYGTDAEFVVFLRYYYV
jgi:hypothetical protein